MQKQVYLSASEAREAAKIYNGDQFYQCLVEIKEAADKGNTSTTILVHELKQETIDSLLNMGFKVNKFVNKGGGFAITSYEISWEE